MANIKLKSQKGFSLVEVLVAVALIATIGVGIITALGGATRVLLRADTHETARDLAEAQMESIQSQEYEAILPDYDEITAPSGFIINSSVTEIKVGLQEINVVVTQGDQIKFTLTGYKVHW